MTMPVPIKLLRDHPTQKSLFSEKGPPGTLVFRALHNTLLVNSPLANAVPVSLDGYVYEESNPYPQVFAEWAPHPQFFQPISAQLAATESYVSKAGEYVSLAGLWCGNFYHWMMEHLIRALVAIESGFKGFFIIPGWQTAIDSLLMLGVSPDRLMLYDGRPWLLEVLHILQPVNAQEDMRKHKHLIQRLRDKLLASIGPVSSPAQRIYVGRSPATNRARRVVNEPDLLKLLEKFGFYQVNMEQLSLRDQIAVASNARFMLGPHGAGMLHCMFMPPKSHVFELFSPLYINPCMLPVIELLQHRYQMFPSTKIYNYEYGEDIFANLFALEIALNQATTMI